MKQSLITVLILSSLALAACGKKEAPAAPEAEAPAPAAQAQDTQAAPAAEQTQEERERAEKQAALDYSTMEDAYINDPHAQWASTAKASSIFGDDSGEPSQSNLATNAIGAVNGEEWTNNKQDVGFDWLEVGFQKPVAATEVRVVFTDDGSEAVTKVELQDTNGGWNTVWSGLSDVKSDERGSRTWFVRKFNKTAYQAKAAKITIANNVVRGYKNIDAVQLVGE